VSNVPPSPVPQTPPHQGGFTPVQAPAIPNYDQLRGLELLLKERGR
jgi:hypothetical protein